MSELLEQAAKDAADFGNAGSMLTAKMPQMVKGKGFVGEGNVKPTQDSREILADSAKAEMALRDAVKKGQTNPSAVLKGMSPAFATQFGNFMAGAGAAQNSMGSYTAQIEQAFADLGKNITLTSPLSTGFVPFDLAAPSRLIYPVYSPLRNKIPRTPGQGTSRREKIVTQISGSLGSRGSAPFVRPGIGEGNLSSYPETLPNSGTQVAYDLNVPYFFNGMSESLSWLAQFASQGFEDASSLANLILLQEMMLAEEAVDIAGTSIATSAPTIVSATAVNAPTGVAASTLATTSYFVAVTGTNYYGETVMAVSGSISVTAGQYINVTTGGVPAGLQSLNFYIGTSATRTSQFRVATGIGGSSYSIGSAPGTGANPPAADSGTYDSAGLNQEGLLSILSGLSATHFAGSASAQYQAGYYNNKVGDTLNVNTVTDALLGMWDGTNQNGSSQGFLADPAELLCEGADAASLATSLLSNGGANSAFRIYMTPADQTGMREGGAVSEFVNPVTRNIVKILVHPYFTQGTALLMSYNLPFSWTNVSNVVEKVVVQDYLSISWPVIDPSFRYSIFWYGALKVNAPQYCGLLQGLQRSDYSATSSLWK